MSPAKPRHPRKYHAVKRRFIVQGLRIFVALAIFAYLLRSAPLQELGRRLGASLQHPGWLFGGVGLTFMGLLMGAVRWRIILDAQGVRLHPGKVFRIFFIGQFFNAFMLGACGGDVARAYYAARDLPGRRAETASTVFVDRAIGLFTIILYCCLVILIRLPFFLTHPQTKGPGLLMLIFLATSLIGMLALFRRNLFEHFALFRRIEYATSVGPLIRRAYEALYLYRSNPRSLALALALSMLNLVLLTLACGSFGAAIGLSLDRPFLDHFTLFPIITTLAAIPLTPGALGLREGLFAGLYGAVGVLPPYAVSLSLMVYAGGLVCSLLGGIFFIGHTSAEHHSLREELRQIP